MSIRHDSPAWFRRIRDEGGPVAQGRAVPLREFTAATEAAAPPELRVLRPYSRPVGVAGYATTAQPPQAAVAPPEAPETGVDLRPWGWAPGMYSIPCIDCVPRDALPPEMPMGDKRAWRCEPCARKAMEADHAKQLDGVAQDPIVAKVCALLLSRSAVGVRKYGTTLARTDLTRKQWAQHALEEALDLACYLQRMINMEDGE